MAMIIFLVFSILLQGAIGELVCEELPIGTCSFAISSSGKRCLLETYTSNEGNVAYQCETSDIAVENLPEWIENDGCVEACGVDRNAVGISSDLLVESGFIDKLCAPGCYMNCPNIVDLYYNLALGEGTYLPELCKAKQNTENTTTTTTSQPRSTSRRLLSQISSSGTEAPISASAPVSSPLPEPLACAPAPM